MSERPLLTLAICCYKFERFIDEALDGAFDQTYRPLEIVVSDDCSPDGSWQHILDKVASRFPNAPLDRQADCQTLVLSNPSSTAIPTSQTPPDFLSLTLNRNPTNLGLARHENRLFELSHGEWIAFQSGDDVSLPTRMERIAQVVRMNPRVRCIECRARAVDERGNPYQLSDSFIKAQDRARHKKGFQLPSILGAGAVYHQDVYRKFGPLGGHVVNEDHVLPLRASLLGDVERIEDVLVLYKKHGANLSGVYNPTPDSVARYRASVVYAQYQELEDLHCAELTHLADLRLVGKYRRLVKDDLFRCDFLAKWHLLPSMRLYLLWMLLCSPRQILLLAGKAFMKLFWRLI